MARPAGRQGAAGTRARVRAEVRPLTSSTPDALWASRSVRTLKPAAVVCEGVSRRLRGQRLLDDLTLVVGVGARLLVVSRPEQSASMLLRVLAGLSRTQAGVVRLAGVARPDSSPAGWARRVGYVGPEAGNLSVDDAPRGARPGRQDRRVRAEGDPSAHRQGGGGVSDRCAPRSAHSPWRRAAGPAGRRSPARCSPSPRCCSSTSRCER